MPISSQPMRSLVTSGMLWATFGTAASKFASFGAQLVLGWVLSKEDFALYAISIAWSTIVLSLRNGGTQRLLIQQAGKYEESAIIFFKIALIFNGLGFLALVLMAPIVSSLYESPTLNPMLWVIALSLPLSTASMVFQAKLAADLNFRQLTQLNVWSAVLRHGSMVAFALTGLGPLSFVLPLVVVGLFETAAGWYLVGGWPPNRPLTWRSMRTVITDTRWIMLTTLAVILGMNGDYLAISLIQSKETLGIYYFGFQLTFSLAVLFSTAVETVMLPAFSRLEEDGEKQRRAFLKAVRMLMLVATPLCFALFLGAAPLVHFLWNGKWDHAVPVVQWLALSLPIKMTVPLCRSLLEGRGEWKRVSTLLLVDGVGIIIAGGLGAWFGGVLTIAAVVSGYNLLFGLFFCWFVSRHVTGLRSEAVGSMLTTFGCGLLALGITFAIASLGEIDSTRIGQVAVLITIFGGSYIVLTRVLMRDSFVEGATLIFRGWSGLSRVSRGVA